MKKIHVVILCFILSIFMMSCLGKSKEIIFLNNSNSLTLYEDNFIKYLEENEKILGYKFKFQTIDVLEEYIGNIKGNNKVIVLSQNFMRDFEDLNHLNEDIKFGLINGKSVDNVFNINMNFKEISYLLGVASGYMTMKNNISVIVDNSHISSYENVLAFMAGVKSINLRAYDSLIDFKNILDISNVDGGINEEYIKSFLIENKSDVVFYLDYKFYDNILKFVGENNMKFVTLNGKNQEENSTNFLLEVNIDYKELIENILNDNSDSVEYNINLFNDCININTEILPEEVSLAILENITKLKNHELILPKTIEELRKMHF